MGRNMQLKCFECRKKIPGPGLDWIYSHMQSRHVLSEPHYLGSRDIVCIDLIESPRYTLPLFAIYLKVAG